MVVYHHLEQHVCTETKMRGKGLLKSIHETGVHSKVKKEDKEEKKVWMKSGVKLKECTFCNSLKSRIIFGGIQ